MLNYTALMLHLSITLTFANEVIYSLYDIIGLTHKMSRT